MNCVNCGCRLTFFNETDELWSGTERVFCVSCRKKIMPFLEESSPKDNLTHLRERKSALIARGITAEGYAHLGDYCRYLDSLLPHNKQDIPDEIIAEPEKSQTVKINENQGTVAYGASIDTKVLVEVQKKANDDLQNAMDSVSTELADSTRIITDRMQKLQERIRLLSFLASAGALGGLFACLAALIVLFR